MSPKQPNRLAATAAPFAGREIDRSQPLSFRLNGREVGGFVGDTVLSAAIASGITQAGWRSEYPLALDERFAPQVAARAQRERRVALPMDRMPATNGLDLITVGVRRRNPSELRAFFGRFFGSTAHSLEQEFGGVVDLAGPWHDQPPEERIACDLVVVGGGVAGMRAAIAAGSTGESVILIERRPSLGGDARFFGSIDEERAPGEVIDDLAEKLAALKAVTVLTLTEAIAIYGREVRAHQVVPGDKEPTGRVVALAAKRVVLAPGSFERLPVFAGNRVPGVTHAVAAFTLADRYGVWIGNRALFNTASGYAYRVAVEAQKAGLAVQRIADTRLHPQSRFIDFSKAYGVPLSFGVSPLSVAPGRRGELTIRLASEGPRGEPEEVPFVADQFVVCGGWQPELGLWHMAGGQSRWVATANRMEPVGRVEGIEVVGAAAGWRSTTACLQSAAAGVAILLGRRPEPIEDRLIDPGFETPDDPTPIAASSNDRDEPAYLDSGQSLTERPAATAKKRGLGAMFAREADGSSRFLAQARALTVGDIAAAVQLGAVAPIDAGTVAQERCVVAGDVMQIVATPAAPLATPIDAPPYPPYLEGRYPNARVWRVEASDKRTFETGCLIYPNSDKADPTTAVGVVLRAEPEGAAALIGGERTVGDPLFVRDISGAVAVRLAEPKPAAPLG